MFRHCAVMWVLNRAQCRLVLCRSREECDKGDVQLGLSMVSASSKLPRTASHSQTVSLCDLECIDSPLNQPCCRGRDRARKFWLFLLLYFPLRFDSGPLLSSLPLWQFSPGDVFVFGLTGWLTSLRSFHALALTGYSGFVLRSRR